LGCPDRRLGPLGLRDNGGVQYGRVTLKDGVFEGGFIAESPVKLRRRLLDYFTAVHGGTPFPPNECNAPWVSSVIESKLRLGAAPAKSTDLITFYRERAN
jgi:hypothetical protein